MQGRAFMSRTNMKENVCHIVLCKWSCIKLSANSLSNPNIRAYTNNIHPARLSLFHIISSFSDKGVFLLHDDNSPSQLHKLFKHHLFNSKSHQSVSPNKKVAYFYRIIN